jgi:hypothetical protein
LNAAVAVDKHTRALTERKTTDQKEEEKKQQEASTSFPKLIFVITGSFPLLFLLFGSVIRCVRSSSFSFPFFF